MPASTAPVGLAGEQQALEAPCWLALGGTRRPERVGHRLLALPMHWKSSAESAIAGEVPWVDRAAAPLSAEQRR